jgi:alkylated DNA repair dioxygenase AlkB
VAKLFPDFDGPVVPPAIPGLVYIPDVIDVATERQIVAAIEQGRWDTTWERRRQLFGQTYGRKQTKARALPEWGRLLAEKVAGTVGCSQPFDQMLVNEYLPGQGIALYRDYAPFDRTVASISLLSPCIMDLRRVADSHRESILLARRSLLVLSDEARYEWEHGIARRKKDLWNGTVIQRTRRISVTYRRLKDA